MIDLNHCNEWQHRDPSTGLVFPWYTKSFLDELVTWDLKDKVVFEYGAGASTIWWARKCSAIYAVESNIGYLDVIRNKLPNSDIYYAGTKSTYLKWITRPAIQFDIVIVDGEPIEWRDDCVKPALECLKHGGKLIIDNWMQPSVGWMPSEETQRLLLQYQVQVYKEQGHWDWQTAVFTKPKEITNIKLTEVSLFENGQYRIWYNY